MTEAQMELLTELALIIASMSPAHRPRLTELMQAILDEIRLDSR